MTTHTQPIKKYKHVSELSKSQKINMAVTAHNKRLEELPPPKISDSQELKLPPIKQDDE